ncbi:MAG: DUF4136 domain-containing protein [Bacteroidaceae bacterium]|nr:DUF4136 domain-containing protein [Bacteroidaceae bacterium]MBQ3239025.1 DUF4136 domain-containing protein [Bacteroidaceae bacterium]MBQ7967661.1 DUF4136 domain-containing protein [Bacteroidaceae bacterium]MBR3984058.1 DUF4136 domain-containing protein [Bacteroidaceae bacterium]MBR4042310.1 DUF4136 domain-containing protein [Bacteroidaceae bacterium]
MKKLIPMLFAAVLLVTACEKTPDTGKLDDDYLVYTNYDDDTDFAKFTTFYVPDSVLIIDNSSDKPKYLYGTPAADILIANYVAGMEAAGYVRTTDKESADLGLQISYVKDTYRFRYYNNYPWWYGYPWYWQFSYWGDWGGWYWPYDITYSYSTGSVLGELVDLTQPESTSKQLKVVWTSYISGLLNSDGSLNTTEVAQAISQAFSQSKYLKK